MHNYPNGYENAKRIESVYTHLENKYLLSKLNSVLITQSIRDQLNELLHATHSEEYTSRLKCNELSQQPDIYTTQDTYTVAAEAVLCAVSLTDNLCRDVIKSGFALIRPPGKIDHSFARYFPVIFTRTH